MPQLKFQHVFMGLMGLSALSAFVLPARYVPRPGVAALFAPVARPSGAITRWAHDRIVPEISPDTRDSQDIRKENAALRTEIAALTKQNEILSQRAAEQARYGEIRKFCTLFSVVGPDSGPRDSLSIQGSSLEGLREGMCVIYPGGVVGQVHHAGLAGTQIKLVTDPSFRVRCGFGRFNLDRRGNPVYVQNTDAPQALVEGIGNGWMVVHVTDDVVKVAKLTPGQYVVVNDPDWPRLLQGRALGRIVSIGPRRGAPLHAELRIEPQENLLRLREVMVMNK